jgi:hypothetical protein
MRRRRLTRRDPLARGRAQSRLLLMNGQAFEDKLRPQEIDAFYRLVVARTAR